MVQYFKDFFAHVNIIKPHPQKLLIIDLNFQYCQPAQNQSYSQFLFYENCSLRHWCIMTLIVYIDPYASVHAGLSRNYFSTPYLGKVHTWIFQWLHALHIYISSIVKSGIDMLKDKNTHTDVSAQSQFPITSDAKTSWRFCHF